MSRPKLLLTYHFFHPDDVVSARQFADLALQQRERGWDVTVLTSNRLWSSPTVSLPPEERWRGIRIVRVFRPAWEQGRGPARLGNSAWVMGSWVARARTLGPFDAVIVGTEPAFAALTVFAYRALWPRARLIHWCLDVFPDAIVADDAGPVEHLLAVPVRALMSAAYGAFDAVVDIGPRMRQRLPAGNVARHTLFPWALLEPAAEEPRDADVFRELFGDAKLGLLYSGTLARAHDFETIVAIARRCRQRSGDTIAFCFACRGARLEKLRAALQPSDTNIRIAGFCPEDKLAPRLAAADLHLMSLRPGWSGIVVPSKFFAALAAGKPVLYAGERDSDLAILMADRDVGLVVDGERALDEAVETLNRMAFDPAALAAWKANARRVYDREFSKRVTNDRWNALLRGNAAGVREGRALATTGLELEGPRE